MAPHAPHASRPGRAVALRERAVIDPLRRPRAVVVTIDDIMTRDVIRVTPAVSIHAAAQLMVEHGVSGLPVVDDDGRLVGIISEGDLILRQTRPATRPWWRAFFERGEQLALEYRKAVGTTVGEVMTRPVISISPVW